MNPEPISVGDYQYSEFDITLYPNPTNSSFYLDLTDTGVPTSISIISSEGRRINPKL